MLGGSADLAPSNKSNLTFDGAGDFAAGTTTAGATSTSASASTPWPPICNGMALCGLRAYGATFFVFTDYLRPSMRLAAMMKLPVLYIFTHDSIGVGEDGPTHQPVEHLAALAGDSRAWWCSARPTPTKWPRPIAALVRLDRPPGRAGAHPAEPAHARPHEVRPGRRRAPGAATCWPTPPDGKPEVILIGTGSEVSLCRRGPRAAGRRGDQGPRGEHALLGTVRRPAGRVPRRGAAAGGHRPRGGRGGHRAGLGQVHRARRPFRRHERLRRLGPQRAALRALRHHGRDTSSPRPRRPWAVDAASGPACFGFVGGDES